MDMNASVRCVFKLLYAGLGQAAVEVPVPLTDLAPTIPQTEDFRIFVT